MKKLFFVFGMIALFVISETKAQCGHRATQAGECTTINALAQNLEKDKVEVIYFHATRRCATCQAVEDVTKEVLKDAFGDKINFTSIDREKDKKNSLLKKYKISGQTLLLVKDKKVVNLTNEAFLNARTNPDKFKEKLKSTIESM